MKFFNQAAIVGIVGISAASAAPECETTFGGKLLDLQMENPATGQKGMKMSICQIEIGENLAAISASATDPDVPTIAATFLKQLPPVNMSAAVDYLPSQNPAISVCGSLGGSEAGMVGQLSFSSREGQTDICIFGDGSAASGWTLSYVSYSGFEGYTSFQAIRNAITDGQVFGYVSPMENIVFPEVQNTTICKTDSDCSNTSVCGTSNLVCGSEGFCVPAPSTCTKNGQCVGYSYPTQNVNGETYCLSTTCEDRLCTAVF